MESHSTENLNSILLHDSASFHSSDEDINQSINTHHTYNSDPSDMFAETDPTAADRINSVVQFLQQDLNDIESTVTVFNSRNALEQSETNKPNREKLTNVSSISLSDCPSKRLQLAYPLEKSYRARYKSDYFPQTGIVRKPRYIADDASNHFITLKLPPEHSYDLENLYIRVALITKSIHEHGHYYSPYKFQKDHSDIKVPDENPTYVKVETSEEENFTIRLQLVLIKSKLDQLNYVQPLQLFSDTIVPIQNIIHGEKLIPKDLISKYQLDQSHIAFTLCTKRPDGSFEIHPESTVISTVITEISTSKKPTESPTTQEIETNSDICCPHCSYQFDPDLSPTSSEKPKSKASRSRSSTATDKRSHKKRKKS